VSVAFDGVIGHERVRALLSRALREGRVPPALLFTGPSGVGKKALALALGRGLLCEGALGDACGRCPGCSRAGRGLHPDFRLVEAAGAAIKIEQVREVVREIQGRPFEGRARAFVIDDAHLMTEQAQNALLKSLEEPPASSHVFLVTPAPQALLTTIRSRCQVLKLGPLPQGLLAAELEKRLGVEPEEARLRAALASGSLGAALAFESEGFRARRESLLTLLEGVASAGALERMEAAEALEDSDDPDAALTTLHTLLRDILTLNLSDGTSAILNADVRERLAPLSRGPLGARAAVLAEAVTEAQEALAGNANKLLTYDLLVDTLAEGVRS
jgi:DNA polymerase-3 subunit delta'